MKLTKSLLIVTLACGTLWAQAPANNQAKPPAKTPPPPATQAKTPVAAPAKAPATAAKPATTAAKPVTATAHAPKPMAHTAAKTPVPVAHPKAQVAKEPVKKPVVTPTPVKTAKTKPEGTAKPASAKETTTATRVGKQRDPFVSPVVRTGGNIGSGCDTGKRCLVVDQIVLKGIVKSPSGFIAVVENPAKRAYFMRENDPVFNGRVTKITGDTVVFQEQVMDKLGKQTMREVVKKVNAPVV